MDTLIIGGGAAGLAAACFAPRGALVLERLPSPGRKLLATGGGRCNLTHDSGAEGVAAALGEGGRFALPALRGFPPNRLRDFFRGLGVETAAEADGCVFPASQKASDVLGALLRAARAAGAEIRCGVRATRLLLEPGSGCIAGVETDRGPLPARRVILATGGQSYPALGSDGSGFALAREAGLEVVRPVPALAGLVTAEAWPGGLAGLLCERAGLRLDESGAAGRLLTGPLLFTHRGLSGPPALALSGAVNARLASGAPDVTLRAAFVAERAASDWLARFEAWRRERGGRALHNLLAGELPRALAETLCRLCGAEHLPAARAGKPALRALAEACAALPLHVAGTEGWSRAMATRGGVAREELDPKTLACRRVRGLFCAGEAVDVDGPCGGYNLTWAFASGRLAGLSAGAAEDPQR